jgi:hypothetical protein
MAVLSITDSEVKSVTSQFNPSYLAGQTIFAGDVVTISNNIAFLADSLADEDPYVPDRPASVTSIVGVALNTAAEGQPLTIQTYGDILLGNVLTAGNAYYLGVDGAICERSDLTAGSRIILLGVAADTQTLVLAVTIRSETV